MTPVIDGKLAQSVFARWVDEMQIAVPISARRFSFSTSGKGDRFIYFAESDAFIKIGVSRDPSVRVRGLRLSPIVFVKNQSHFEEHALHRRLVDFCALRSVKRPCRAPEWFARSSPVLSLAFRLANAARLESKAAS